MRAPCKAEAQAPLSCGSAGRSAQLSLSYDTSPGGLPRTKLASLTAVDMPGAQAEKGGAKAKAPAKGRGKKDAKVEAEGDAEGVRTHA